MRSEANRLIGCRRQLACLLEEARGRASPQRLPPTSRSSLRSLSEASVELEFSKRYRSRVVGHAFWLAAATYIERSPNTFKYPTSNCGQLNIFQVERQPETIRGKGIPSPPRDPSAPTTLAGHWNGETRSLEK